MENIVEIEHHEVNEDIEEIVFFNSRGLQQVCFSMEKIDFENLWNKLLAFTALKENVKTLS